MQNFGIINETFKNILVDSIISKNGKGKQIFKKYVKALKESSALTTQYQVYNNLETKVEANKDKSLMYVTESISLLKELGKDTIIAENTKLVNFLIKNGYKVSTDDYNLKELHENIDKLVMNEKTSKNLDTLLESKYFINDFINTNVEILKEEKEDYFHTKTVGKMMVEKFNNRYDDDSLTESEMKVIKSVIRGNESERKELYGNMIRECVELVDEQLKECTIEEKDKLLQVKDKLLRFKYNEADFISEMSKIVSLKSNLI